MTLLHHVRHAVSKRLRRMKPAVIVIQGNELRPGVIHRCNSSDHKASALFVSNSMAQHTTSTQVDLDLRQRFGAGLEALTHSLKSRGHNSDIQPLLADFRLFQQLSDKKKALEEEKDIISETMRGLIRSKEKTDAVERSKEVLKKRGKDIKENLKALMPEWWAVEERVVLSALRLPNHLHPDTPVSEPCVLKEANTEREERGKPTCSHVEVGRETGMIRLSNVGPKAFYLRGDLAVLEQTLQSYVTNSLRGRGFTQLSCPEVFRSLVVEGTGVDIHNHSQVFTISGQEAGQSHPKTVNAYHLTGVSAASFSAFLTKSVTKSPSLPLKYFSVGRSYSPTDIDEFTGLYATSQSIQAHILAGCNSIGQCEEVRGQVEELFTELYGPLQLPVRLVVLPAPELRPSEMYRCEVQVWAAPYNTHIQVGYVSILGDFISRRLNIHTRETTMDANCPQYLNMVHGCVMNVTRLLAALVEYSFDQSSGNIAIPDVLQPHHSELLG